MKLKLDENLGQRGRAALVAAGHDVETVVSQKMTSATDDELFEVCAAEGRAMVTLDLDFSNPLRYPPAQSTGIAVLRLPKSASNDDLDHLVQVLIQALRGDEEFEGRLWIVEAERIRVYQPEED